MYDSETLDYSQGISISGYEAPEFTCFCCGICCRKYYIRISLEEALGIAAKLDVSWEEWLEKYTDPVHSGSEHFVLRRIDGGCVFLKHDNELNINVCSIHAFKPTVCQDWVPSLNQPDCREGLARFWEINIDARGELKGSSGKLKRFFTFLKSLSI